MIVVDPMLATGNSASAALSRLKEDGVTSLKFVCLLAAPRTRGAGPATPGRAGHHRRDRQPPQRPRLHRARAGRRRRPDLRHPMTPRSGPAPQLAARPKGRVRRQQESAILNAAERVFARTGFEGGTMTEIASLAGVPKANLHYYFRCKDELYRAVLDNILSLWLAETEVITIDADPASALSAYVAARCASPPRGPMPRGCSPTKSSTAPPASAVFCAMNSAAWSHSARVGDRPMGLRRTDRADRRHPPVLHHLGGDPDLRGLRKPGLRGARQDASRQGRPRSGLGPCHHRGAAQLWAPLRRRRPCHTSPAIHLSLKEAFNDPLHSPSPARHRPRPRREQPSSVPAAAASKIKVAAIYTVPVEQQWVSRIHKALEAAKARNEIDYVFSENVANADYERVMRQYAESGNTLIVGEAFAVEAAARKVARDYPGRPSCWVPRARRRRPTSRSSTTTSRSRPTSPA